MVLVALLVPTLAIHHAGPDFSTFVTSAAGSWRGAELMARVHPESAALHLSDATDEAHEVADVEQGIREVSLLAGSVPLTLDRSAAGFSFFSLGSWSSSPTDWRGDASERVVHMCLANRDGSRHRLQIRVDSEASLLSCRVAIQGRRGAPMPQLARSLLDGCTALDELDHSARQAAWAGAEEIVLSGKQQAGSDATSWANDATTWDLRTVPYDCSATEARPVVPADAVRLPDCCMCMYVHVCACIACICMHTCMHACMHRCACPAAAGWWCVVPVTVCGSRAGAQWRVSPSRLRTATGGVERKARWCFAR